jgi:hypothetical protein
MERSVRWLDRCIDYHEQSGKKDRHNLFAIVQGGLDHGLRDICLDEMIKRKDRVAGYAIGGLSGGEEKGKALEIIMRFKSDVSSVQILSGECWSLFQVDSLLLLSFYRMKQCADKLPEDRLFYVQL